MAEQPTVFERSHDLSRSSVFSLPPDLLQKSGRRLRLIATLTLLAFGVDVIIFVGQAMVRVARGTFGPDDSTSLFVLAGDVTAVAASIAVILATRSSRLSRERVLAMGLVFEVVLCSIISLVNPWAQYMGDGSLPALTWVSPLIIMFPLIVPVRPKTTAVTAFIAASTAPVGLIILHAIGAVSASADDLISAAFNPVVAALFAIAASRVVYELGMDVSKARHIGSYRLEQKLGSGGMGEVWRARHRLLARPAAVKLIHPAFADVSDRARRPEVIERFEREAQATAMMRSPHTIQIYDYGVSSEGAFYYVMELLDGLDADRLVKQFGPVSPERAVFLLRQACDSLAEAHEQGLIHRDIKPANVYVCRYGRRYDFIKVLDFGLVKSRNAAESTDLNLTAANVAAGTPAYMSPEQALGKPIDGRADLYALGCVAYWLLTGRLVFDGATSMEIITQHVHTRPVAPSQYSELNIPKALDALVLACLEKDAANRPQSADALDEALAGALEGTPWSQAQARRFWETHGLVSPSG